jgi:ABC-2 type transport system permease protein
MTAFAHHCTFEFKTGLRNSTLLMLDYLFPLGFYALMGLVMTQINPLFGSTIVPAMVSFTLMTGAVLGLPSRLVEAREAGIYRSFKINGVPAPSILAIPALTTIFHALIAGAIVAASAGPLFKGDLPVDWAAFALVTLLTACCFGALGALIGVISANSRATVLWSQLIFLPSMLLGGLMVPLEVLPDTVRPISGLLPTTYAMQAYLGLAYRRATALDPIGSTLVLAAGALLAFCLAIYLFNWDSKNQSRRGHPLLALLALLPFGIGVAVL